MMCQSTMKWVFQSRPGSKPWMKPSLLFRERKVYKAAEKLTGQDLPAGSLRVTATSRTKILTECP